MTFLTSITGFLHLITLAFYVHPIHVSVTEIEFDKKDAALEIMMRVFIDDLELTLRNSLNNPQLDILNPPADVTVDALIRDYLKDHFSISLDNKPQQVKYLGHEREGDAMIFFIEVKDVSAWKTIRIHNDIIMSTHDDQSNLVHVYVGENVKSLRLTRDTPAQSLTFD
jgi:hypothetical protein